MNYNIALLKGDGIGPEIVDSATRVLEAVGEKFGHRFNFTPFYIGGAAIDKYGIPRYSFSTWDDGAFLRYEPVLAVDMYEHAYFNDYGFEKEKYLRTSLEYLDLERLASALDNKK